VLIVAGAIVIDPAKRDAATAAFDTMRAATLTEAGCLEYQAYFDRADPGVIFVFERWRDETAVAAHFAAPHMATFRAAMAGFGIVRADVRKYEVGAGTRIM
jgi:quinol monooxygenase YgiN